MKINVFPIVSNLHEKNYINRETKWFLADIETKLSASVKIVELNNFYKCDLPLILIQSGGSEKVFLDNLNKLKPPFYLLTYGTNNSLAASLEILSYLKDHNFEGEVLHGSVDYIVNRIKKLTYKLPFVSLGVIGKPSDWLIASDVDYEEVLQKLNIKLVDIKMDEVIEEYHKIKSVNILNELKYDEKELNKSKALIEALLKIKYKYKLSGLTIRCFDLLDTIKTTACLGLAYFNKEGIIGTCEGDIPSMLSMYIANIVCGSPGFQANPSRIDVLNKTMVFAHCTLPLNMTSSFALTTHYESGIGVAVKGEMKEDVVTIFKLSRNLKDYFVTTGKIVKNLNETNLCRTQIEISVDENIEYFLNGPYGNHHIIVYGNHKDDLEYFMKKFL